MPGRARSNPLLVMLVLTCTLGTFGCDHVTKAAAKLALDGEPSVSIVPGILDLKYVENTDIAFSAVRRLGIEPTPSMLLAAAGIALVGIVLTWAFSARHRPAWEHAAFGLIVAGALGNVVDRAARGYVIDFIHVTQWPVFNIADVAVVVGTLLLLLGRMRGDRGELGARGGAAS